MRELHSDPARVNTFTQQILEASPEWLAEKRKVNGIEDAGFSAA
jgi:hypothetical protein